MTEEEGHRHLKDHYFMGLNPISIMPFAISVINLTPNIAQLVMALRKAETETLGSSVSEVRAKSAVVGADTDSLEKKAISKPSYEAVTQQIAYIMSAVANQTNPKLTKAGGCTGFKPNGNGKYPCTTFQRPKHDRKNMTCWGCGGTWCSWRECPLPDKGINLPLDPTLQTQIPEIDQI